MTHILTPDEKRRLCKEIAKSFEKIRGILDKLERNNKSNIERVSARNIYLSMKVINNVFEAINEKGSEKDADDKKKL